MGRTTFICLPFIHVLLVLLYSGSIIAELTDPKLPHPKFQETVAISGRQMDVSNPMTTVPTSIPLIPSTTTPNPVLNPTDSGEDSPANAQGASAGSWCVASQSASQAALQVALDYACGHGGADCSAIQPGGRCFDPITVRDHASYAFNSYYQKNPIPNSCNFGGSALTTATDPSYGTCRYPSISTTSSVLNTTNSMGSQVFGAGPIAPSTSSSPISNGLPPVFIALIITFVAQSQLLGLQMCVSSSHKMAISTYNVMKNV